MIDDEAPARFRSIHRRIATALARRGQAVAAMRHAAEAADAALLGRIMIEAGGIRIYVRDGPATLLAADRCLMAESLEISGEAASSSD